MTFRRNPPLVDSTSLQKQSYAAGLASGLDPTTPYGVRAPEGLDPVAFAAGLIEGRGRLRHADRRKRP